MGENCIIESDLGPLLHKDPTVMRGIDFRTKITDTYLVCVGSLTSLVMRDTIIYCTHYSTVNSPQV